MEIASLEDRKTGVAVGSGVGVGVGVGIGVGVGVGAGVKVGVGSRRAVSPEASQSASTADCHTLATSSYASKTPVIEGTLQVPYSWPLSWGTLTSQSSLT